MSDYSRSWRSRFIRQSIPILKLGRGHGGDGDGIGKVKIKRRELCEVCGCFIQWSQGLVVRSKSYEIER